MKSLLEDNRGMALIEYALITAILVMVGIVGAKLLQDAGEHRRNESIGLAADTVPCGADLSGEQCY